MSAREMRRVRLGLALALVVGAGAPAFAESCGAYRAGCEAVCKPDRIARFYAGFERRCSASCEPRFQQCIRSGVWADLERLHGGGWLDASIL